jgi:hypothetical protein
VGQQVALSNYGGLSGSEVPAESDLIWLNGVGEISPVAGKVTCETLSVPKDAQLFSWTVFLENEIVVGASVSLSNGDSKLFGLETSSKHESFVEELMGLWGTTEDGRITHVSFISDKCRALAAHLIKNEMTVETKAAGYAVLIALGIIVALVMFNASIQLISMSEFCQSRCKVKPAWEDDDNLSDNTSSYSQSSRSQSFFRKMTSSFYGSGSKNGVKPQKTSKIAIEINQEIDPLDDTKNAFALDQRPGTPTKLQV